MAFSLLQNPKIVDARKTLQLLIDTHRQTIKDIEAGKKFWRGGEDVTNQIRSACLQEIEHCFGASFALDKMKEGDIQRAAALCEQIKEFIPPPK